MGQVGIKIRLVGDINNLIKGLEDTMVVRERGGTFMSFESEDGTWIEVFFPKGHDPWMEVTGEEA